jgi:hypothetical protein
VVGLVAHEQTVLFRLARFLVLMKGPSYLNHYILI